MVLQSSRPAQCRPLLRSFLRHKHAPPRENTCTESASTKLFADAAAEEALGTQMSRTSGKVPPTGHPNWTGDESVEDAMLRMLVDKYRPLRGASIRTAEEKLKSSPPKVELAMLGHTSLSRAGLPGPSSAVPNTDGTESHKPWLTTFRAPSHTMSSIRQMRILPSPVHSQKPPPSTHSDDHRTRTEQRKQKKKAAHAGRLGNARESSLDYRLGKVVSSCTTKQPYIHRQNPTSAKGWTSLVEERIERARNEGYFRAVKGRGKPIVREDEERNPFISREEFLMNRIIERQGAVSPWIEIQGELEAAVASFREIMRSTWTRRSVRRLLLEGTHNLPQTLTLSDVTGARMRDPEWEEREAGFHEEALKEVNALVRKYNGVAPYFVRRPFLSRRAELERMYDASGPEILVEITRRTQEKAPGGRKPGEEMDGGGVWQGRPIEYGLRCMWNRLAEKIFGS